MSSSEKIVVDQGGYTRWYTSAGTGSSNVTSFERCLNGGTVTINTDQGTWNMDKKSRRDGIIGDHIFQADGNQSTSIGGLNEIHVEGSDYKIVADGMAFTCRPVNRLDELKAGIIAYRSSYCDDRNDIDFSSMLKMPSFGLNVNDIAKAVKNQTNNNPKLPDMPEETGNFIQDAAAAVDYDVICAEIRIRESALEQAKQGVIGKLEMMQERLKNISLSKVKCDPKVKEELEKLKERRFNCNWRCI